MIPLMIPNELQQLLRRFWDRVLIEGPDGPVLACLGAAARQDDIRTRSQNVDARPDTSLGTDPKSLGDEEVPVEPA
jgi:hypothetical protein